MVVGKNNWLFKILITCFEGPSKNMKTRRPGVHRPYNTA